MLYETIFKRRAVRKYDGSVPNDVLADIQSRINNLVQLPDCNARFEIVDSNAVNDKKAPHYILAFCEESPKQFINVGYCLQEIDLYIQSLGYGSLWLGMAKPKEKQEAYCIMLAFGKSSVPFRANVSEFDRLDLAKIANANNKITSAMRLAPSAVNSQPWKIDYKDNQITINYCGRGLLKGMLKKKMSKIDVGILAKVAQIALINEGKQISAVTPFSTASTFGVNIEYV